MPSLTSQILLVLPWLVRCHGLQAFQNGSELHAAVKAWQFHHVDGGVEIFPEALLKKKTQISPWLSSIWGKVELVEPPFF